MPRWVVQLVQMALSTVLAVVTPEIREKLGKLLNDLASAAAKTPNKYDDILVDLLKDLLGYDD